MREHGSHTHTMVFGGQSPKTEVDKLTKGANVLVATPGRLMDHLQNTRSFVYKNLLALVIDEADHLLKQGFEEEMRSIVNILPKTRQTMLFSATQTTKVQDLIRLSFANAPTYIGVKESNEPFTVSTLTQGYAVVPAELRFLLLYTFLKKYTGKKIIVFFAACAEVQFFGELLNYIDVPCWDLHGKHTQARRTKTFLQFKNSTTGVMLCTDVAARGLDIPNVDWIIQYDPPHMPQEYIHRVGRTARAGKVGNALMFLMPEEIGFLKYLQSYKIPVAEWEYPANVLPKLVQAKLTKLLESNYYLYKAGRDAYRGYMLAYNSHMLKDIFNVSKLDVDKVAISFGLPMAPTVSFNYSDSKRRNTFGSDWSQSKQKNDNAQWQH
eukprot:NODE_60_length_2797_cov_89.671397_g56_i0.p1 GENE.NODE_60_length_2797_cov_89.671397_g56_i0~~NODE_60_length_2797_cov_89.671397_g56_i0.p1  ORF type:complete len:380 (+),score=104.40 NODE_60_length_2797_cov_89.671397_g56_i0:1651-2790(+)